MNWQIPLKVKLRFSMKEVLIIGSLDSICLSETKFPEKNCKFETLYPEKKMCDESVFFRDHKS